LPLAIELAAARIRFLSPSALLARLDRRLAVLTGGPRDLPARQQTLRATIAWSHDLLEERDRVVFRRASVFVDGWALEAAEAICSPDGDPMETIDALSSLVDKSLIRREEMSDGEARFGMLQTIRELAAEHLAAAGELDAIQRRHAEHFLALAEEAEPHLALDPNQLEWIARLDGEVANLEAAFAWCTSGFDATCTDIGLRLSAALCHYWAVRSGANEARVRIQAIERLVAACPPSLAQAKALHGASMLARELSDYETAERLLRYSLAIARQLDETRQIADNLNGLGWLAVLRGRAGEARALFEESLSLVQRLADAAWKARVLTRLGYVSFMEGDYARAMTLAGEGATIARVIGDLRALADALVYLGLAQQYNGDLDQARRRYEEGLPIARRYGDRHLISMTVNILGQLAVAQGSHDEARRLLREALLLAREVGNVRRLSFSLSAIATLAKARGDAEQAVRLDAASRAAAESVGTARAQPARAFTDGEISAARTALGEAATMAAAEAGRRLTVDQAVDEALAWLDAGDPDAEAERWQRSPWTVFGWSTSGGGAGFEVPAPASRRGNGGLHVFGEGGAVQPR
jgi:tetratricopeptide (TPR) repeat protein